MGIIVNTLEFQSVDGQAITDLSIVYAEHDHQSDGIGRRENITVNIGILDEGLMENIADLQDLSCAIVDDILLHQRNPPKEIQSRRYKESEKDETEVKETD